MPDPITTPGVPVYPGPTPSWWRPMTEARPEPVSLQDYAQQFLTNMAIKYMLDPSTQQTTAHYLARDNPAIFGGSVYGALPPAQGPVPGVAASRQMLAGITPAYFATLISELEPAKIKAALPASVQTDLGKTENLLAAKDVEASARWLNEYLKTASLAAGTGRGAPTRGTLGFVREHLGTLSREAQDAPLKAGRFATLAENLVNPVVSRAPTSGLFGFGRAVSPPLGEYRRGGVAFRNPFAT